jgi:hypothetical protein
MRQMSYQGLGVNPPLSNDNTYRATIGYTNVLSGSKLPSFRSLIANGYGATTSCSGTFFHQPPRTYTEMGFTVQQRSNGFTYRELYTGFPGYFLPNSITPPPSSLVTSVTNRCIRLFLARAKSAQRREELGETLGELRETVRLITNPLQGIRTLIKDHFRRLKKSRQRYRDKASLSKALSDSYLEFVFGWNPLAKSVSDGYRALQRYSRTNGSRPSYTIIRASASDTYDGHSELLTASTDCTRNVYKVITGNTSYTVRYIGAIGSHAYDSPVPELSILGLSTVNDFAVTAWNLIPYSFLIDYFLNIGDVIDSYTFRSSDLLWGNKTVRTCVKRQFRLQLNTPALLLSFPNSTHKIVDSYVSGGTTVTVGERVDFIRSRLSPQDLIARLEFRPPGILKPWINIAALISSNRRSLTPFFKR